MGQVGRLIAEETERVPVPDRVRLVERLLAASDKAD
jgi:hypothetical protein